MKIVINQHHYHASLVVIRPTTTLFQVNPGARRKADQLETSSERTRLVTMQSPETLTEHATVVSRAESQAIEDQGFVTEMLLQVKSG